MTIISAAILLLLVMDPFGNSVVFISVLNNVDKNRRGKIVIRELLIALAILTFFLFFGQYLLAMLKISQEALSIAGGIVLFLISLKLIFPPAEGILGPETNEEPFVVPLATPLIAGPSALAVVMLLSSTENSRIMDWLVAILLSWGFTAVWLYLVSVYSRLLSKRLVAAVQRLMGMILTTISVQMVISSIKTFF